MPTFEEDLGSGHAGGRSIPVAVLLRNRCEVLAEFESVKVPILYGNSKSHCFPGEAGNVSGSVPGDRAIQFIPKSLVRLGECESGDGASRCGLQFDLNAPGGRGAEVNIQSRAVECEWAGNDFPTFEGATC